MNFPFRAHRQRPIFRGRTVSFKDGNSSYTPENWRLVHLKIHPLMKRKKIIWTKPRFWEFKMLVFAAVYDETTGTNDSLGWTRWYFFGETVGPSWGNFRRRRIARIFEVPCCRGSGDLLVSWWVRKPRARLRKLDKLGVGDGGKFSLDFLGGLVG